MTRSTIASDRRGMIPARILALLFVWLGTAPATAQPKAENVARADSLFREARKLMNDGRFAEACPKFAESQRLDPAAGTLLNLGICHAGEGKVQIAYTELKDALETARKDGRADREKIASEELAKLEPRLSRLTVAVAAPARVAGLEVKLDGTALNASDWGTAHPVDPGVHRIEATAPGHTPFTTAVEVGAEGDMKTIDLPVLAKIEKQPPEPKSGAGAQKTAAYVVGGAGIVAIGVGGAFGIRAIVEEGKADDLCPSLTCAKPEGLDASNAAKTSATVANVAIGAGLAAVGVGVVLLLTARSAKSPPPVTAVTPLITPRGGGAVWQTLW